jgi:FAD/FMN-containing dehydrogenase
MGLICPGGESGLIINTLHLDRVVSVDKHSTRMTFKSGVTHKDLIDVAANEVLALPAL